MDAISNRSLKARVGALAVSLVMATAIATPPSLSPMALPLSRRTSPSSL